MCSKCHADTGSTGCTADREGGGRREEGARELTMERMNEFVFIYDGNGISSSQYSTLLHQASPRAVFFSFSFFFSFFLSRKSS